MILQFFNGLSGDLHVTFEEGTAAAWLYDLLKPHVARLVVCNPGRNALLKVATRVTASTHGNWPNYCVATNSTRFITVSMAGVL
jgi:hypothetical protein